MPAAHLGFYGSRRGQQGVLDAGPAQDDPEGAPALSNAILCRLATFGGTVANGCGRRPGHGRAAGAPRAQFAVFAPERTPRASDGTSLTPFPCR